MPPPPIESIVFEGQSLLVQVIKDPIGTKGARLSTQISIAGRLLVFLPQDDHIGISQKIGSTSCASSCARACSAARSGRRRRRRAAAASSCAPTAEDASDAELADDIAYLRKTWARIRERAAQVAAGVAAAPGPEPRAARAARPGRRATRRRSASTRASSSTTLREFGREYTPARSASSQHYTGERPIFDLYSVDEEIEKALARRVDLKSGGYLIIDQTEALTTIDVNTGGFVGARNFDDTIFKTNLEAAQAIARQLRLRNLGGIIIVDFIDMERDDHRDAVLAEFKQAAGARPHARLTVSGFTQLGLVEMTRKRTRESLAHMLCEPCPTCQGRGEVKTARSVCYDILREILREARQFNPREFRILASQPVIEHVPRRGEPAPRRPVATSSASRSRCRSRPR